MLLLRADRENVLTSLFHRQFGGVSKNGPANDREKVPRI
jgi:hypothetical protein